MKKRQRINRAASKANFSQTASRTHKYNVRGAPMRGGIRL